MRDPGASLSLLETDTLPPALLSSDARGLGDVLPGPTLVHLPGRRPEPLFVSVLLHGNETSGLRAIQQLLAAHAGRELPRALSIFFGNVEAAQAGVRRLDAQPDYNRVWPGGVLPEGDPQAGAVQRLFGEVLASMRRRRVFASIDLHNTTGHNPYYCCVTALDVPHLQLASLFSRTVVHFRRPEGTQTSAFSKLCPSVACECGQASDPQGAVRAAEFVTAVLHLAEIPAQPVRSGDVHLFHTVATVRLRDGVSFSFDDTPATLRFPQRARMVQLPRARSRHGPRTVCRRRACLPRRARRGRPRRRRTVPRAPQRTHRAAARRDARDADARRARGAAGLPLLLHGAAHGVRPLWISNRGQTPSNDPTSTANPMGSDPDYLSTGV